MRSILLAAAIAYPIFADAENRIGLRIDHVQVTREFLTKLEIKTTPNTRSLSFDRVQALFVDQALRQSRQGNVLARPKATYASGEVVRFDIPPKRNKQNRSQVWDAEHGLRFTLTPTLASPGIVHLALRPGADDGQLMSVAVPAGHTTAFVVEANATQLRLLIVRPHIY